MAMYHDVVIDGRTYRVPEDVSIEQVKESIRLAARSGGDFVTLDSGTTGAHEVLVTALTPIRIEHGLHPEQRHDDEAAEAVIDDTDWWF